VRQDENGTFARLSSLLNTWTWGQRDGYSLGNVLFTLDSNVCWGAALKLGKYNVMFAWT